VPNVDTRHPASVIHLAARLRALLGLTTAELALVVGVEPRTLSRMETWSGSLLTSIRALAETSRDRAPALLVELAGLHAQRNPDPPDPAELSALGTKAEAALAEVPSGTGASLLAELCAAPLAWIYWATSERAGDTATRDLADQHGLIVRPLLQKGTTSKTELHGYLLALQPGDEVLLCHDATPVAWYQLTPSKDTELTSLARQRLQKLRPSSSDRSIDLVDALPAVFRHVELGSALGKQLAANRYHLFDNSEARGKGSTAWFSGLCVAPLAEKSVPSPKDFTKRPAGERARMTRFRSPPPA
jgi:hypothetical protein